MFKVQLYKPTAISLASTAFSKAIITRLLKEEKIKRWFYSYYSKNNDLF